jgi:hypothetical protein
MFYYEVFSLEKFDLNSFYDLSVKYCLQNCCALTFTDRMWTNFIDLF